MHGIVQYYVIGWHWHGLWQPWDRRPVRSETEAHVFFRTMGTTLMHCIHGMKDKNVPLQSNNGSYTAESEPTVGVQ